MKNIHWILIAVAGALLLAIVALWFFDDKPGDGGTSGKTGDNKEQRPSRSGQAGFISPVELERLLTKGPSPKAMLEAYRLYARYPPDSRPLTVKMKDLTDPWKIKNVPLPVIADPALGTEKSVKRLIAKLKAEGKTEQEAIDELKQKLKGAPKYLFELNQHTISLNEELRAVLKVTKDGSLLPYQLQGARLEGDVHFGKKGLGSAQYREEKAGLYVITWKAPSAAKKYWGSLTLIVRARVPGIDNEVVMRQSFYSSPVVPAVFIDRFDERLQDGSLVIDATLDVKREGRYSLHANLFSLSENAPTHWAAVEKVLEKGEQKITFKCHGKIFRDGGYEGKFELQELRGTCENMPFPAKWIDDPNRIKDIEKAKPLNEPLLLYVPRTDMRHKTRSYRLNEFSDKEWASPDKDRRMQRLRSMAGQ